MLVNGGHKTSSLLTSPAEGRREDGFVGRFILTKHPAPDGAPKISFT
jgi:hypothetical protein